MTVPWLQSAAMTGAFTAKTKLAAIATVGYYYNKFPKKYIHNLVLRQPVSIFSFVLLIFLCYLLFDSNMI